MKRKYHGIFAAGLLFTAVCAVTLYYLFNPSFKVDQRNHFERLPPLSDIKVPTHAVMKDIYRLEKILPDLLHPSSAELAEVNLEIFGHTSGKAGEGVSEQKKIKENAPYLLSFAFASETECFCIINGQFYAAGGKLPGGGEIIKIEWKRVLIKKGDIVELIQIPDRISEMSRGAIHVN